MTSPSGRLLLGYSLFLALCATIGLALSGFDLQQHIHGVRLALVIAICGMLAGRFQRNPALAMLAIDFAALLILVVGLNYVRLCLKWYGIDGPGWYTSYLAAAMALGGFLTLPLLLWSRPKKNRHAVEWWRPSPLIALPIVVLIRFPRCRHGLGIVRRNGLTLGALMLIIGVVLTNGDRVPRRSVATIFQTARLAKEHHEFLRDVLDDPQELKQILTDRKQMEELLDDPRAQDLIEDLTAIGGLLEGTDVAAVAKRVADGDLTALDELLDNDWLSAAKALLADIDSKDGALSELLDKDELAAAKTLLSRAVTDRDNSDKKLDDEARSAAKKLLLSAADSDSKKRQNVVSVLQKVGGARHADFSGNLPDLMDIDINDPIVLRALRELDISPKEAARLASSVANASHTKDKFSQRQLTAAAIANHLNSTAQSRLNSKLPSQRTPADRLAPERQSSRLANQSGSTFGSHNDPRLGVHSIQVKPVPEPLEPLNVFALVDPQPDFLQQRLGAHLASAPPLIEPTAPEQPIAEQPSIPEPEAVATAPITVLHPVPVEITIPQIDDQPMLVAAPITPSNPTEVDRNDRIEPTASALTHLGGRLPPIAGTLCMLAGFLTVGVSLSRR